MSYPIWENKKNTFRKNVAEGMTASEYTRRKQEKIINKQINEELKTYGVSKQRIKNYQTKLDLYKRSIGGEKREKKTQTIK